MGIAASSEAAASSEQIFFINIGLG